MLKRPNPSESEADILALQNEFFKQRSSSDLIPAAKLVGQTLKDENSKLGTESSTETGVTHMQIEDTFEEIPEDKTLRVFERSNNDAFQQVRSNRPRNNFKRNKLSLFAQKRLNGRPSEELSEQLSAASPSTLDISSLKIKENDESEPMDTSTKPLQSYVITGNEKIVIHEENMQILNEMSEEEILEEREKLLAVMDPALVEFLKAKRNGIVNESRTVSIEEQNKAADDVCLDEIDASKEVLEYPKMDKWVHFDDVEAGKLAWMKNIEIPVLKKGEVYEARFDFEGYLLPFTLPKIDESNRSLYHHGEDPGRPGYTLQELFQLCRSSIIQQKVIALQTIANILMLNQTGIYYGILEIPVEQIFFVLRFSLDDNSHSVLNASLKAIRCIFVNLIDEQCLNNVTKFLNINQPVLSVDENGDDVTVNDQQLAELNLVKCLLRTGILERIRYIINTVRPPKETVLYCLDILVRLAHDSNYVLQKMFDCEGLLDSIIQHFVPADFVNESQVYDYPIHQAIHLLKILSSRSNRFASELIYQYKIMDNLSSYLYNEYFLLNSTHINIQVETMDLISVITQQRDVSLMLRNLLPAFLKMLCCHINRTDALTTSYLKQQHLAKMLDMFNILMRESMLPEAPHKSTIFSHARLKWMNQFCALSTFTSGQLLIGISVFKLVENYDNSLLITISSKGFHIITEHLKNGSNLLCRHKTHKSSPNLLNLEAACWEASGHIVPVLHNKSSILFLAAFAKVVEHCKSKEVKLQFLHHPNIKKYVTDIHKTKQFYLVDNWFTRVETRLILSILQIAVDLRHLNNFSLFYELGIKCIPVFDMSQTTRLKIIFKELIFNKHFFLHQTLRQSLSIPNCNKLSHEAIDSLNEISNVYLQVLDLNQEKDFTADLGEHAKGNFIPVDWIYSPIILFYSNHQQPHKDKNGLSDEDQIIVTKQCLYWIYIYETFLPHLANLIDPTDRYCRLACTFLGSDTMFLNDKISVLLETCLRLLVNNDSLDLINFNRQIEGLNNFQDFFTQLLEQYQGVSYGSIIFGNFLLLPLMQKHNIKYRKTLWSEYAGVVQIFNVTNEQVMYPTDLFLNPKETDQSLLKCYKQAIGNGAIRRNSFLFQIAKHHLNI